MQVTDDSFLNIFLTPSMRAALQSLIINWNLRLDLCNDVAFHLFLVKC